MVDAAPFRALRYDPDVAGEPASTSAPAYDDFERLTYAHHRAASPYTVLELLAPATATTSFEWSAEVLRRWRRTGVLVEDDAPAYYLYEEHELRHGVPAVLRGILAAVRVGDPSVHPHEDTDPGRVVDRVARLRSVPVDLAPVFAVYPHGPQPLRELLRRRPRQPPVVRLTDENGMDHRVWRLQRAAEIELITRTLAGVDAVIADGHHRYAAAVAAADSDAPRRVLMYLVDGHEHGPQIMPVHRVLRGGAARLDALDAQGLELHAAPDDPQALVDILDAHGGRAWGVRLPGRSHLLVASDDALQERLPAGRSPAWAQLDAAAFEHVVVPQLRLDAVGYSVDLVGAWRGVDASRNDALVIFRAVDIDTVYECAIAGDPMPAKTTWFRPKPRAGLVMRSLHSA